MIKIIYPIVLCAIFAPFIIYLILPKANKKYYLALKIPFFHNLYQELSNKSININNKASSLKYLLFLIWCLVVVSGSGIEILGKAIELPQDGRDIVMDIDLSQSMSIKDMQVNNHLISRFQLVTNVASKFVNSRKGDRIALILFGSKAYVQTPLTFDIKTVENMIKDSSIGLAGPNTAIGDSIGLAVKQLMKSKAKSRAIILLTDGENTSGSLNPIEISKIAKQQNIKIYTIGLGSSSPFVGRLNTKPLQEIAKITDGKFFRAYNSSDLKKVYDDINKLEKAKSDKKIVRPTTVTYLYTLGLALILSFLYAFIWLYKKGKNY